MLFYSTRNKKEAVSSKEAIINGLAKDGGLYVPEKIEEIKDIYTLQNLDYKDLAFEIISRIFDDLDKDMLKKVICDAYGPQFQSKEITPVKKVGENYLLDLTKGPTCAFKDIALQFLPRILAALREDGKKIVILCATSGDTGKAALEGFKNLPGTEIEVLYPHNMVSKIQEKQMTTTDGNNTKVLAVRGNFDDCQSLVKDILSNEKFENIHLTSANSINIARLVPQIVYYFKAYFDLLNKGEIQKGDKIDFVVPTGNFGDILAGYMAKKMGLPVGKLCIASNENNVLTKFFNTGVYDADRDLKNTMSPSIDILVSSNLERLLYFLSEDDALVSSLMKSLSQNKKYELKQELLNKFHEDFLALDCSEAECRKTIADCFQNYGILIDPHTAVALSACKKCKPSACRVILSTASPFKFSKDVYYSITGEKIEDNLDAMDILAKLSKEEIPENLRKLKNLPVVHRAVIEKDDRKSIIESLRQIK